MRKLVENFAKDIAPADSAGRLDAPAFHRNKDALAATLCDLLGSRSGDVIEIGSGTGQHAAVFAGALPNLRYWPSDPITEHLVSIEAWRAATGHANLMPASRLDSLDPDWLIDGREIELGTLTAIIAINVIHVAPWSVAEAILANASRYLTADGLMIFYGPYRKNGAHTANSNAEFDASLKARNPAYGVRDLEAVIMTAKNCGLALSREIEMPANNLTLVFERHPT